MPGPTSPLFWYLAAWTRPLMQFRCALPTPSDPLSSLGDALSVAGCGWHLEDTAQQMYQSLAKTLGTLPPQTVREPSVGFTCLILEFSLVQPVLLCLSCFGKVGIDPGGSDARLGMRACPSLGLG